MHEKYIRHLELHSVFCICNQCSWRIKQGDVLGQRQEGGATGIQIATVVCWLPVAMHVQYRVRQAPNLWFLSPYILKRGHQMASSGQVVTIQDCRRWPGDLTTNFSLWNRAKFFCKRRELHLEINSWVRINNVKTLQVYWTKYKHKSSK